MPAESTASRLLLFALVVAALACGSERSTSTANASSTRPLLDATVNVRPSEVVVPSGTQVDAYLDETGVSITVGGKVVGSGCTGESGVTLPVKSDGQQDFLGVRACARKLKSDPSLAIESSVTVSAFSGARYADVVELIDALRSDTQGEIFPEFHLGIARMKPATHSAPTPAAASAPASPRVPASIAEPSAPAPVKQLGPASLEPGDEGAIVRISKTQITVGDDAAPVVSYPNLTELRENGLDVKHKRNGPHDLYIVPLANVLIRHRATDKALREATGRDASTSEIILIADADVPYRVLFEVLYTAGQSEFGKYHLLVRTSAQSP